ncbi:MAG TPA: arsenate reductase (glutaredoxin) [Acidimicrobiia bacterium]|jgi:arsenate reductase
MTEDNVVVYHNPVCSKSRGALEILGERGVDAEVIEYLKVNPSRADLERIVDAISDEPAALVRKDKRFKELELDAADYTTRDDVVAVLLAHPELMERPVVFVGDRAVIARPSERVTELLD